MIKNITSNVTYMPICLNIKDEECLVVGGGKVAWRKIKVLKKFGAKVTCLSLEFILPLKRLAANQAITCLTQGYSRRALSKYKLVIAATDNADVNKMVAADAARAKVLVNVVDKSAQGSVIMPAILKRKGLTIGVSTDGRNPSEAKKIRDVLSHAL